MSNEAAIKKETLSVKGWTAYAGPIIGLLILAIILAFFDFTLIIIPLFIAAMVVLQIKSYKLYIDEDGVNKYSGAFPWNKGSYGVRWENLDCGVYYPNFISWVTKTHSIRIRNKHTQSTEIYLNHMTNALEAIRRINQAHENILTESKTNKAN